MTGNSTRIQRIEAGLCIYCGENMAVEKEDGTLMRGCDPCLEFWNEKKGILEQQRIDRGQCARCKKKRVPGRRLCKTHLERDRKRSEDRRATECKP